MADWSVTKIRVSTLYTSKITSSLEINSKAISINSYIRVTTNSVLKGIYNGKIYVADWSVTKPKTYVLWHCSIGHIY